MPRQLQALIEASPTYEQIVRVPDDGEMITSASFADPVVALGRRIEYLRQRFDAAPWLVGGVFDDFQMARVAASSGDGSPGVLACDTNWLFYRSGGSDDAFSTGTNDGDMIGALRVSGADGEASAYTIQKSGAETFFGAPEYIATSVRVGSIASGMKIEFGLIKSSVAFTGVGSTTPTDAVSVLFDPSVSANWQLRQRAGGSQTLTNTGVAVVAGTTYDLKLEFDDNIARAIIGNVQTFASTNPEASVRCGLQMRFQLPASGSSRFFEVDYIAARYSGALRAA